MAYCPKCGYEYEDHVKICPDCEVELVDKLNEEHFDGEMVEVFSSFSPAEAGMVKELLYNEGIFAALSNELGSAVFGSVPSEVGEVRVFVSEKDAEEARELIAAYIEEEPMNAADEYAVCGRCGARVDMDEEVCPYCGEPLED